MDHVMRMLLEYRDEGGRLQWLAQTCPGVGLARMCVRRAVDTIHDAGLQAGDAAG